MVSRLRRAIALLLIVVTLGLVGCGGDRDVPIVLLEDDTTKQISNPLIGAISEVSPPERIQQLKPYLDVYEPQVRIVAPRSNETLTDTTVSVELQVRDFSIYKDQDLELGPHLHLFLDDQPYQAVYDTSTPIVFENLTPGTHTLRVFASRPWHESFKNAGAYDQVTFNVFTESPDRNPDDSQALLTYSRPQGSYGAEPIMLDFYLTNAPLHLVAQEDETITDWRLRCTVNGESFVFDRWQPIYLKGFKPGKNWVKLELIDDNGNLIDNAFNTGIRIVEYTPGGDDGLAKLVRGEIPLAQAKVLVDPNYVPPAPVVKEAPASAVPAEPAEPKAEKTPRQAEPPAKETPTAPEPTVEVAPPEAEPTAEEPLSAEPETPAEEETQAPEPTAEEPEAEPKQSTPMPAPEPTAEPGMLPEIVEEPTEPETEPEPQTESEPAEKATPPIAPQTLNETPAAPDSTLQPPARSDTAPLVIPDTVEEFAPPSESAASPVPETPDTMESRRQKRQRSRFSRDRLLRRNPAENESESETIPETPSSAAPATPPESENPEQAEQESPAIERSPTQSEASQPLSTSDADSTAPDQPDRPSTEDESAIETLEETSDVI